MDHNSPEEKSKAVRKTGPNRRLIMSVILIAAGLLVTVYSGYEWLSLQRQQAELREAYEISAGFRNLYEGEQVEEPGEDERAVEIEAFEPMRLVIPSIEVDLIVLGDVDAYDREVVGNRPWEFPPDQYQKWLDALRVLLDQGPVYYQLSDLPSSEGGNVVISAHRAGRWNFFRYLDQLQAGDEIHLDVSGYRFTYLVEKVVQVDAHDWAMFFTTEEPVITLQTCTPLGVPNPPYRLNARGILHEVKPLTAEGEKPVTPEVD